MVKDLLSKTEKDVWNRDDYYIVSFRRFPDGSIILQKCNNTYLSFNGLKPGDVGKYLRELFTDAYVFAVQSAYEKVRSAPDCLTHVREIDGSYWESNIYFEGEDLRVLSKRIPDACVTGFSDRYLNHINFNKQRDRLNHSMILRRDNRGRYFIEQHSGYLSKALGVDLDSLQDFAQLIKTRCTWFQSTAVLDDCVRTNKPLRILEIFRREKTFLYILVTLLPLVNGKESRVILSGFQLDEDEFYHMQQQPMSMFDDLLESKHIGFCLVTMQNTTINCYPNMLRANLFFEELLADGTFTLADICEDHVVKNCMKKHAITTGNIDLPSENGFKRYFLCAVPTESSSRCMISLCPKENLFTGASILFATLTQREHEVVNYVVDGRTNRQIACALDISEGTVKKIIYNAYQKLHIASRIDLIKLVLKF